MSAISQEQMILLEKNLASSYLPYLPALIPNKKSPEEIAKKNVSRAFSAFVVRHLADASEKEAAESVVDDFDDYGVDSIFYSASTQTVFIVQSKIKASQQFSQEEALAFCQGIRKLLKQDFSGFNQHVQNRVTEITDALDTCNSIQLVIAHTGSGISKHAADAVSEVINDETHGEERLASNIVDFDSVRIALSLQASKAFKRVDATISIQKCSKIEGPPATYYGVIKLADMIALHKLWDKALYTKNIRTFLGHETEVNTSIQRTLGTNPGRFFYLNNGITVLGEHIAPKSTNGPTKRLDIKGFSVINGAQTIASSAKFSDDNPGTDLKDAKVMITVIKADGEGEFGKSVTRARNHQNPVLLANFVALEDEQERLRRDLAHLDIHYIYKAEASDGVVSNTRIRADEAIYALAMFHPDPRYIMWLKNEPSSLLDTASSRYKDLFTPSLTAFQLANSVRYMRYVRTRMEAEARGYGPEKLTYKHGLYTLAWALAKRILNERNGTKLFESAKIPTVLSTPIDGLRQHLWDKTMSTATYKAPIAIFRSQSATIPILIEVLVENYGLAADAGVAAKRMIRVPDKALKEDYPQKALIDYLVQKAPQIGGLV